MKRCADEGEVMPDIPQIGRFWTSVAAAHKLANCGRCSPAAALEDSQRNARPSPVGWMRPAEMLRPNAQCVKRIKHHSAAAVTPGLISVARG